ncbi:hypothetical protein L873DRAFT_1830240 [Choiromyces venosus 120613-1]|uniref:PRP1 splicing factor N-terminal domain-containing protein n=1 Tax=Choiromyces venosus 120613-1 TaxID=1336337 RepID=A0A3N4JDT6_9PEZI|nr:hypothetical protein L873DRAFT_1830240 [Choiromyces venosus 120613-1]
MRKEARGKRATEGPLLWRSEVGTSTPSLYIKAALARSAEALGQAPLTVYDDRFQDPENEVGHFARGAYDEDKDKADRISQSVDEKMERRRKSRRKAREKAEREEYERKNPKIHYQLADLKRGLETLADDDWANLPEVGGLTGRNRRARQAMRQMFYPTLDSVFVNYSGSQFETSVQDEGTCTVSADTVDGTMTNFREIRNTKIKVLAARLDRSGGDSVTSDMHIVPKGYLTLLNWRTTQTVLDNKNKRKVGNTETNTKHGPGGIAAARLEEVAGFEHCPKTEEVWSEAMRLNEPANAKIIVADSVRHNPKSKRVLREAHDIIPHSIEDLADAKILLARAVQLLTLAGLETFENIQALLNNAHKAIPTSPEVWIATARLQGQQGNANKVNAMKQPVQALARVEAVPTREDWIKEAEKCEKEGAVETSQTIIRETPGWQLADSDRKKIWMDDAQASISRAKYETARAIYACTLSVLRVKENIRHAATDLEKNHGTKEARWNVLGQVVEACPQSEGLWLMLVQEKWRAGGITGARIVLRKAFGQGPNNEDKWLSAFKLEAENTQHARARELLATARGEEGTDMACVKSVAFTRQQGNTDAVLDLADKLWMMKDQIYETKGRLPSAQEAYNTGTKEYPTSVPLWLLLPRLEKNAGIVFRARLAVPKSVWNKKTETRRIGFRAKDTHWQQCVVRKQIITFNVAWKGWVVPLNFVRLLEIYWGPR